MRTLKYLIFNGLFVAAGVYGEVYHARWAWNIFTFIFWFVVAATTLIILSEKTKADINKKPRSVPQWFDNSLDIVIAISLAAAGHFWMAGFWLWQAVCGEIARSEPEVEECLK